MIGLVFRHRDNANKGNNARNTSFQNVATIALKLNSNNSVIFELTLDQDAADIMGEDRITYSFYSMTAAKKFASVLQSNFDALHDEALED
jgi:hypothetical protein